MEPTTVAVLPVLRSFAAAEAELARWDDRSGGHSRVRFATHDLSTVPPPVDSKRDSHRPLEVACIRFRCAMPCRAVCRAASMLRVACPLPCRVLAY